MDASDVVIYFQSAPYAEAMLMARVIQGVVAGRKDTAPPEPKRRGRPRKQTAPQVKAAEA